MSDAPLKTVLFLCTGNYYRSRFSEILFNHLAQENGARWRAESRGLATELGINNLGPLSIHARNELDRRGIAFEAYLRSPLQTTDTDINDADIVVALQYTEHQPFVEKRHPQFINKVEYWEVKDVGDLSAIIACAEMERQVRMLIHRLAAQYSPV